MQLTHPLLSLSTFQGGALEWTIAYPFQCTFPSQHDTIINIGTFYNIKKYEIIWPRMQWYHNGKNCFHSSQLHLHLRKQGEIECHYHHNFFQIFLAFLEKFLTITVSENVNGSSSSTVSLWSDQTTDQPVEPLYSFEFPPADSSGELGSLDVSRNKFFNMKEQYDNPSNSFCVPRFIN